ncbi:uncharacterized protein LOC143218499 [Lasioglossum baleicum]|uniref:uncharacterized protein LOC143218499 n=1 Tax=Lasioglossum baleicum TaxID=434251 RepID=UPI003FCDF37B
MQQEECDKEVLRAKPRDKKYERDVAVVPECRTKASLEDEYRDFPEVSSWIPNEQVNDWLPIYLLMARSYLMIRQQTGGIPLMEAMENARFGDTEEYIIDTLHSCNYKPDEALKKLQATKLPQKLISQWSDLDSKMTWYSRSRAERPLNHRREMYKKLSESPDRS